MSEADKLVTTFKRKGHFDKYRKQFYDSFYEKVSKNPTQEDSNNPDSSKLDILIKEKMKKMLLEQRNSNNPKDLNSSSKNLQYITQQNKGKVSGLLIGSLYKDSELDKLIDSYVQELFLEKYPNVELEINQVVQQIRNDDMQKDQIDNKQS